MGMSGIVANTSAFQAEDAGSIPVIPSKIFTARRHSPGILGICNQRSWTKTPVTSYGLPTNAPSTPELPGAPSPVTPAEAAPPPVAKLHGLTLWDAEDVKQWVEQRSTNKGRKP